MYKQFGSRSARPDILSGLIWAQTVYKGYQQTRIKKGMRIRIQQCADGGIRTRTCHLFDTSLTLYNLIYLQCVIRKLYNLCMLGNLSWLCCHLLFYFFQNEPFRYTLRVVKGLDPDQDQHRS